MVECQILSGDYFFIFVPHLSVPSQQTISEMP